MVFRGHVAWAAAVVLVWLVFLFDACSALSHRFIRYFVNQKLETHQKTACYAR